MSDQKSTRWFRSNPSQMQASRIDAENGIIYDVIMVTEGPAKGHGVHLDADFVDRITAYDKAHYSTTGLKARFGHPGASSETMGTQLGTFRDFRKRKNRDGMMEEIANLHLLEAADESPTHPGMRQWVLKMAEENPNFIMSSIVFRPSGYFQRKNNGHKHKISDPWEANSEYSTEIYVEFEEEAGAAHYYTDLVEQGAATDSLFSNQVNTHLYVVQVENFLNDHPHIDQFLKNNPDAVGRWLARAGYSITNTPAKKMSKFSLSAWLFGQDTDTTPTADDMAEMRTALQEARQEIQSLRTERDEWKQKYETSHQLATQLAADAAALRTQVEQLSASMSDLTKRLSVVEEQPAEKPTAADTVPAEGGATQQRAYQQNPLNRHIYGDKK